jgi:HPr kinase/phosphorylase
MATIHASCVTFGGCGILIRGASGAGKSRTAHFLINRAPLYGIEAHLVGDDRIALDIRGGRLFARAPEAIAGLLEVRGLGLVRMPFLKEAHLDLVIDLAAEEDIPRLPTEEDLSTELEGVSLPRCFSATPEGTLDVLLTIGGHAGGTLEEQSPLASVRFDGKTKRP